MEYVTLHTDTGLQKGYLMLFKDNIQDSMQTRNNPGKETIYLTYQTRAERTFSSKLDRHNPSLVILTPSNPKQLRVDINSHGSLKVRERMRTTVSVKEALTRKSLWYLRIAFTMLFSALRTGLYRSTHSWRWDKSGPKANIPIYIAQGMRDHSSICLLHLDQRGFNNKCFVSSLKWVVVPCRVHCYKVSLQIRRIASNSYRSRLIFSFATFPLLLASAFRKMCLWSLKVDFPRIPSLIHSAFVWGRCFGLDTIACDLI